MLSEFMKFQNVFRLEHLEIGKDLYSKIEDKIVRLFVWTMVSVGIILILMFLLTNVIFVGNGVINIISTVFQIGFYLLSANLYFWTVVSVLRFMYWKHRYEFRRHAIRQIGLIIVTPISIWMSSVNSWLWLLQSVCKNEIDSMKLSAEHAGLKD